MSNGEHEIRTPKGLRIGNRSVVDLRRFLLLFSVHPSRKAERRTKCLHPARAGTQSLDLLFRAGTAGRKAECRKGRNRKTSCCTV